MAKIIPFAKELRETYPYATDGHKKKCTCFICGLKRDQLWANDNPYQAEQLKEQLKQKREEELVTADRVKSTKASQTTVIMGNKYYKETDEYGLKDTIHCSTCLQRLGGMSYPCPFGHGYGRIFGRMINNPADERWNLEEYNKSKFQTTYQTVLGTVTETSAAENSLKERRDKIDDEESLT